MDKLNYYELLGVKEDASFEEIKTAYKNQMKKWHPDINSSKEATNMSIALNEAKKILLDETSRRDYDNTLKAKRDENYNHVFRKEKTVNKEEPEVVNEEPKNVYVSKWVYLKDWFNYGNNGKLRKILGVIGVLLETLLCKIIVLLLFLISYLCYYASILVQYVFSLFGSLIAILIVLSFFSTNTSPIKTTLILIIFIIFIYFLNFVPNFLLSTRVFDFLYNKLDVWLFKKCVGYPKI